jgi:hypothetical protein
MFFQLSIQKRDARMLANRLYLQVKLNWEPLLKKYGSIFQKKVIRCGSFKFRLISGHWSTGVLE